MMHMLNKSYLELKKYYLFKNGYLLKMMPEMNLLVLLLLMVMVSWHY